MTWQRTVGVAAPLTGEMDAIGGSVVRGAERAASELQETGAAVSVRVEDTAGDPDRAESVVEGMVADGVPVVVGPISSDVALRIRDLAEEREIPHLPAVGGNPDVTRPGTRYTFRFAGSNRQNAHGTLRFFRSVGATRLAVVAADFSYPRAVVRHLQEYAPAYDAEIGPVQHTPLGTGDFTPLLEGIDPDRVDGLFLPYPGNNATTLIGQLRDAGLFDRCVVLGDYSYGSTPYRLRLETSILGAHNWGVDTIGEASRRLSGRLDGPVGVYHFLGYDIARLAGEALAAVDGPTPRAVRDELAAAEYDAASGWGVRFDESGRNDRYRLLVNRWVDLDGERRNVPVFRSDPIVP